MSEKKIYETVFGKVDVPRTYYWTKGKTGICPLDDQLNLPVRMYSYFLQETVVRHSTGEPYDKMSEKLENLLGISISSRSTMDILQDVSINADNFRNDEPAPSADDEKEILVVTLDGKGVPMRKETPANKKARLKRGEKNQKKKMCCVSAIYTNDKNIRTAKDILDKKNDDKSRSRPNAKKIRGKLGSRDDKDKFVKLVKDEAGKRISEKTNKKVFICDGERFLWSLKEKYFSDYVGILDFYHLMEKFWDFSHCLFGEGSGEAEGCVNRCIEMVLSGNLDGCLLFMKAAIEKKNAGKRRKKVMNNVINYIAHNREHLKYDVYLAQGLPIGSGNVESACKNLVKDRMEGCGMRWSTQGATAMLSLRAIYLNGNLSEYFKYHVEQKRIDLYGKTARWKNISNGTEILVA